MEGMHESLAVSMEAMSLGTFSVSREPSIRSGDLRSTFSVMTPLYPSSICHHSPATTLSSLQSTPSTLPSLNSTPTICGAMSSSSSPSRGGQCDTRAAARAGESVRVGAYGGADSLGDANELPDYDDEPDSKSSSTSDGLALFLQRRPLLRSGKIFEITTSSEFPSCPPPEKVLLLDQEQVSEWDIVVNPNGYIEGINEGSRRFLQLIEAMATPYYKGHYEREFKTSLSLAVVEFVCAYGGRFVNLDDDSDRYKLLDKAKAREKTSQNLREHKPCSWTMVDGFDLWKVANATPTECMPNISEGLVHIDGKPGKWDVIGGRGGGSNHHEGNRRFRGLIEQFKLPYHYERKAFDNQSEDRKKLIMSAIVDYIKSNGGRFVEISNHRGRTFDVKADYTPGRVFDTDYTPHLFFDTPTFKVQDGRLVEDDLLLEVQRRVQKDIIWDADFAFRISEVVEESLFRAD